jgi:hypothetical protein
MKKIEKIYKEELNQAQYIGEDGSMVVAGYYTPEEAYKKMSERWIADCGEEDWKDFQQNWLKSPDDLSVGWLHLVTPDREKDFEPYTEWFISFKEESDYEVYIYHA